MSATMRTTLQTVPESLPADHVTNAVAPVQGTTQTETSTSSSSSKSHSHATAAAAAVKNRSSSSKVSAKGVVAEFVGFCTLSVYTGVVSFL
ncbi:uncharacterized protein LOC134291903 [Aedes albopictus]|uniref:Secreted protein n=1 Tax=Aedes albopictus TaxID=7160 RepID=A0ABM1ZHH6_AEDAL